MSASQKAWILKMFSVHENHENRPGTMKNQPGTIKNHENRPGTIKNHENRPETMKNQPGRNKQKRYKQRNRQNLPFINRYL